MIETFEENADLEELRKTEREAHEAWKMIALIYLLFSMVWIISKFMEHSIDVFMGLSVLWGFLSVWFLEVRQYTRLRILIKKERGD